MLPAVRPAAVATYLAPVYGSGRLPAALPSLVLAGLSGFPLFSLPAGCVVVIARCCAAASTLVRGRRAHCGCYLAGRLGLSVVRLRLRHPVRAADRCAARRRGPRAGLGFVVGDAIKAVVVASRRSVRSVADPSNTSCCYIITALPIIGVDRMVRAVLCFYRIEALKRPMASPAWCCPEVRRLRRPRAKHTAFTLLAQRLVRPFGSAR